MQRIRLTPLAAVFLMATILSLTVIAAFPTLVSPATVTKALNTYCAQLAATYDRAVSPDPRVPLTSASLKPLPSTSTMTADQARFAEAHVGSVIDSLADSGLALRQTTVEATVVSYTMAGENVVVTARVNTVFAVIATSNGLSFDSARLDWRVITLAPARTSTGVDYTAISDVPTPPTNGFAIQESIYIALLVLLVITLVLPLLLPFMRRGLRPIWPQLIMSIGLQVAGSVLLTAPIWFNQGPGRGQVYCLGGPLDILDPEATGIFRDAPDCLGESERRFTLAAVMLVVAYGLWLVAARRAFRRRLSAVTSARWPLVTWWILVVLLFLGVASLFVVPVIQNWGVD